jgi:acyl transferase domain-containing protein
MIRRFLDRAALAAQELAGHDLFERLHAAWSALPTLERLRCWLHCALASGRPAQAIQSAIKECPTQNERQRALLYLLNNELAAAASLLAEASPLGWSGAEHPGHILFPLFARLLGCASATSEELLSILKYHCHELYDFTAPGEARLKSTTVEELAYTLASTDIDPSVRQLVVGAMRKAAEGRCRAVTANQRRSHYGHAATLVTACAEVDGEDGQRWAAAIRALYRRYPAFRRELDQRLGRHG